ncbi:serine hydrolase [bacterium]|nr:serine hydrolase [bacterium]
MPRSSHRPMAIALAVAVLVSASATAADLPARIEAKLDGFLAENPAAPGASVTVICPRLGLDLDVVVGSAARDEARPLTPAHTYRIASNTKTYVAAAVLRLVERGELALDDVLADHLPPAWVAMLEADGYRPARMTLAQVLAHTSGLAEHPGDDRYAAAVMADPHHRWTREEQLRRCLEWFDPLGEPGERFVYSDTGYILLGEIIERRTGRGLAAAVRELLAFERLGLEATWWEQLEPPAPGAGPRAHQYVGGIDTHAWDPSLDLYGGGGLVSSVRDMAVFMRWLLVGEVLHEQTSLAAMTGRGTAAYRLGLFAMEVGGHHAFGHSGFWNTFAYHFPALDLTLAGAITSRDAEPGRVLAARLVEVITGEGPTRRP